MGTGVVEQLSPQQFCSECGKPHTVEDLVKFGDSVVCAECKPMFVQRMREGTAGAIGAVVYGGFWRRFVASMVDQAVLFFMVAPLFYMAAIAIFLSVFRGFGKPFAEPSPVALGILVVLFFLVLLLAPFFYYSYFTAKSGSTPGKGLLGLKIVTVSGRLVGTGRAIGRVFAKALSSLIFYIGDIMAGFDSQKRALHDRICDTRVIRIDPTLFGRRIGAFAVDMLILMIFSWTVVAAWNIYFHISIFAPLTAQPGTSPYAAILQQYAKTWPTTAISMFFQMLYSVYFTSQKGATPGKMLAGLKVVTATGAPVGVGRALGRYLSTAFVSQLFTFGIGMTMAAFDTQCRALEDRICRTRVVSAEQAPLAYPA